MDSLSADQNIKSNTKAKKICLTCMFLIGAEKLIYKKLNTNIKNNYIIGLKGNPHYLPLVMK